MVSNSSYPQWLQIVRTQNYSRVRSIQQLQLHLHRDIVLEIKVSFRHLAKEHDILMDPPPNWNFNSFIMNFHLVHKWIPSYYWYCNKINWIRTLRKSMYLLVIDRTPNTFGKNRTEPNRMFGRTEHSAENGPICRTRSAVLAEHSSVCRTIVRQKNSSVRFGSAEIGFGRSLQNIHPCKMPHLSIL